MAPDTHTGDRAVIAIAGLVVVGTLLLSGVWLSGVGEAGGQRVGTNASERYAALDGLAATRTVTYEREDGTSRTVAEFAARPGEGQFRQSIVETDDRRYDLTVANGSVLWRYDEDANNVTRIRADADYYITPGERIERLFAKLNVTDPDERVTVRTTPGVEPLPVVPGAEQRSEPPAEMRGDESFGVAYEGTATVDGREVYVVHLSPLNESVEAVYEQRLWIDSEWFVPLKHRTTWTEDGQRVTETVTLSDVRLDPGLDDGTFEFRPPENASVSEPAATQQRYPTIGALRAEANVTVPEPEMPPGYELRYASRTTGRVEGVGVQYVNETSRISVAKYEAYTRPDDGDERVTVGDRTGQLTYGYPLSLSWSCGDYRYTVRGWGVSEDRLLAVARSVECT